LPQLLLLLRLQRLQQQLKALLETALPLRPGTLLQLLQMHLSFPQTAHRCRPLQLLLLPQQQHQQQLFQLLGQRSLPHQ
jgi:hypothetical protein